jgi:hypothetical protein
MRKTLIAALFVSLSIPGFALAQDKDKKAPSPAQKKQQERMKDCNDKAADKKGDERKKFMSSCLKAQPEKAAATPQQQKMKDCNAKAADKKGDERKKFMSACLKG